MLNINSLKRFKDELALSLEMNDCLTDVTFIFLYANNRVVVKNIFSIADADNCNYFIVIGKKRWKNLSYTNLRGILIGMCSNSLFWETEIPLNHEWKLVDITFSHVDGDQYYLMKPTLVVMNSKKEKREFTPEVFKGANNTWSEVFPQLFELAFKTSD